MINVIVKKTIVIGAGEKLSIPESLYKKIDRYVIRDEPVKKEKAVKQKYEKRS